MKVRPSIVLPSVRNRDLTLRKESRYIGLVAIAIHLPLALAVEPTYWAIILLPTFTLGCLHFAIPPIVVRFGPLTAAATMYIIGPSLVGWLVLWLGLGTGIQFYLFTIAATGLYFFHGFHRAWTLMAVLPVALFAAAMLTVGEQGLVPSISPQESRWLALSNAVGAFVVFLVIGSNFSRATDEAESLLVAEMERSERLLLNILPEPIARRLKCGAESVIADRSEEVSVLFADLVSFSSYASQREPATVVGVLNTLFSRFDARVDALGLEKIKTVGDAYMVIGGAPVPRPDHLLALTRLALDLIREVEAFRDPDGQRFAIRIGLHVGPAVTGVIGTHKMAYDVWGDTVNVASRLESSSLPDCIQVSDAVVERLGDRFAYELRGATEIKGVGAMVTYFLTDRTQSQTNRRGMWTAGLLATGAEASP